MSDWLLPDCLSKHPDPEKVGGVIQHTQAQGEGFMAQAIEIPSPSVFLRKSPPAPEPPADEEAKKPPDRKNAPQPKRQNSAAEGKKKAAKRTNSNGGIGGNGGDGVAKPKQSKSRNGECFARLPPTPSRFFNKTLATELEV